MKYKKIWINSKMYIILIRFITKDFLSALEKIRNLEEVTLTIMEVSALEDALTSTQTMVF